MLQHFEIAFLEALQGFFLLPSIFNVGLFTIISATFIGIQFAKQKENRLYGVVGVLFGLLAAWHLFKPDRLPDSIEQAINSLLTPHEPNPLPGYLEVIFENLVAPADLRHVYEEIFSLVLFTYLMIVGVVSLDSYRKTGQILGSFSLNSLKAQVARPKRSKTNELGSGDLAGQEHIEKWTSPSGKPADTILSIRGVRGADGFGIDTAKLHIPRGERNRHMLIVAKTGGGKTTRLITPILYNDCMCPISSSIIIDSKPEMWRMVAAMTRHYNPQKNIMLFNPLDLARTYSWNILSKIENDTDAKLIANTIIQATDVPTAKGDSPFFRNNALAILNSIMIGLLHDKTDTLSMPRIHEIVQSGMKNLCDWLERRPHALRNTRAFIELARSGSQNADTIMSELSMRLSAWDLHAIRASTALNELNLADLIDKPSLFVVELRESELEMLRPMANVIVVEILRYLTKRAESYPGGVLPRPVSLIIDEFASALGRLPDIHVKLNTLRSRNVSIIAAVQSLAQIKANYSDNADSVIAGFSTKIFIPTLEVSDAEWASKETGQMTVRFQTQSTGSNKKLIEVFASKNDGKQEQVQQRAVLTPDEIGRPRDNIQTFFLPNTPAFQGFLVASFENPEMAKRIKEFSGEDKELKLRQSPIHYEEILPESPPPPPADPYGSSWNAGAGNNPDPWGAPPAAPPLGTNPWDAPPPNSAPSNQLQQDSTKEDSLFTDTAKPSSVQSNDPFSNIPDGDAVTTTREQDAMSSETNDPFSVISDTKNVESEDSFDSGLDDKDFKNEMDELDKILDEIEAEEKKFMAEDKGKAPPAQNFNPYQPAPSPQPAAPYSRPPPPPPSQASNGSQFNFTDTTGWSEPRIRNRLEEIKVKLNWHNTMGSARKWWEAFEKENATRAPLILRLSEELLARKATISDFFLAFVYSNSENVEKNLEYLDQMLADRAKNAPPSV
jgi:type IV secretory pathway TraG/TraD family ATPase VirD4